MSKQWVQKNATLILEETDSLELSNVRNPRLMGAAIPVLDFKPGVSDFAHIYKKAHNCELNWKGAQESNFRIKKCISSEPLFFWRWLICFPKLFLNFAWSIFVRRYFKLMLTSFSFLGSYSERIFSSQVLIFQTFIPVFNSTCNKNLSCGIICEKETSTHKNAQRISGSQGKTITV